MFVERFAARRRSRAWKRWDNKRHGPAADLRTRRCARPAPAPHRGRHRPRHHAFAGGRGAHGVAECLPDERGPRDPALGRALPAPTAGAQIGATALADAGDRPAQHHRLGQALHGPRPGRHRAAATSCPTTSSTRRAWCSCARVDGVKSPVEVSAEILRDAAPARRRQLRRRAVRRGDHRAGLLRRRAAPGHQGRGAARRPERAAPDQRAHGRRDRLRPGERLAKACTPSTTSAAAPSTSRCCA